MACKGSRRAVLWGSRTRPRMDQSGKRRFGEAGGRAELVVHPADLQLPRLRLGEQPAAPFIECGDRPEATDRVIQLLCAWRTLKADKVVEARFKDERIEPARGDETLHDFGFGLETLHFTVAWKLSQKDELRITDGSDELGDRVVFSLSFRRRNRCD